MMQLDYVIIYRGSIIEKGLKNSAEVCKDVWKVKW